MADIYIVYSSANRVKARELVEYLSKSWSVWWDDLIVGSFADEIEREMPQAKCVVALWSAASRASSRVRDELVLAEKAGVVILPVKVDECEAPYGYGDLSWVDLRSWDGHADHPGFQQLLRRLDKVVPPKARPKRPKSMASGRLAVPSLFLSVSSHETQLSPLEAVKALRIFRAPTILVSAYDLLPGRRAPGLLRELKQLRNDGGFVLIDSGNYEASRRQDAAWRPDELRAALAKAPHDWAFCFDVLKPANTVERAVQQILDAVQRDREFTNAPVLPIVHARVRPSGGHDLDTLPTILREIADRLEPPLIAVPERELGAGLIERARTVRRIRNELDQLPFYQPLHLLGTGNPWSIAVLAAAGADSFDGLEWCRVSIDRHSHRLNHFQHFDFFTWQARLAESAVALEAQDDDGIDFVGKAAFHNLDYFAELATHLRQAAAKGSFEAFVTGLLGQSNTAQLTRQMPELFL